MRKKVIAGNWKMYKIHDEALHFVNSVSDRVPSKFEVETIIFAPFLFLKCLTKASGDNLKIGAQNMHFEKEGAYTGEVSAAMLKSIGINHVIIGHSERRKYFNETDAMVNKKLQAAFDAKIVPILCVGETLEEREKQLTKSVLKEQITLDLLNFTEKDLSTLIIAYEPIWAIGTGKTATEVEAEDACSYIRTLISDQFGEAISQKIRIQYGGSVKPSNIEKILSQKNIDGVLIGGASLNSEDFIKMTLAALK